MSDDEKPRKPTRLQRRIIDAAAAIGEADGDNPEFIHALLCHVGLPRSGTSERFFVRSSGNASLRIEAGSLYRGYGWEDQPLPYGVKPRLVLLHLCSEAIKTQNPEIDLGRSARDFLGRLGLEDNGREYLRLWKQTEALAACKMRLGWQSPDGRRTVTISTHPISSFEAWTQHDQRSMGLWPGGITLSGEFFTSLQQHAVPLDSRAIAALQHSALALDVYAWAAHRLLRIRKRKGVTVSWGNLKEQFGHEYASPKNFKHEFQAALVKVRAVYPDARIQPIAGGLRLYSSPPPIPLTRVVVSLPPAVSLENSDSGDT